MTQDNKTVTLQFDQSDLPMLIDAFTIASTTALMCGAPDASARLRSLRKMIEALTPELVLQLFRGNRFYDIAAALRMAKAWEVRPVYNTPWDEYNNKPSRFSIIVDDKSFKTDQFTARENLPPIEDLIAVLEQYTGLEAVYTGDLDQRKPR
jgi:hypothetical protein